MGRVDEHYISVKVYIQKIYTLKIPLNFEGTFLFLKRNYDLKSTFYSKGK